MKGSYFIFFIACNRCRSFKRPLKILIRLLKTTIYFLFVFSFKCGRLYAFLNRWIIILRQSFNLMIKSCLIGTEMTELLFPPDSYNNKLPFRSFIVLFISRFGGQRIGVHERSMLQSGDKEGVKQGRVFIIKPSIQNRQRHSRSIIDPRANGDQALRWCLSITFQWELQKGGDTVAFVSTCWQFVDYLRGVYLTTCLSNVYVFILFRLFSFVSLLPLASRGSRRGIGVKLNWE